jgi:hypothetical protein
MFLERRGIGLTLSWNYACLAEALALAGEHTEALAHADAALARVASGDALGEVMALRARALARAGQGADPQPELQRALEAAQSKESPREEALVELCRARLLPADSTRDALARRLQARFDELTMPAYASLATALRA